MYDTLLFNTVNNAVDLHKVIERYTGNQFRNGFIKCPFHNDNRASLSVHSSRPIFKCWSCGAYGDTITFTSKLLSVSPLEALKKLDKDFRLNLVADSKLNYKSYEKEMQRIKHNKEMQEWANDSYKELATYYCDNRKKVWDRPLDLELADYVSEILRTGDTKDFEEVREKYGNFIARVRRINKQRQLRNM